MSVWIEIHCDTPDEDMPESVWRSSPPYGEFKCDRLSSDYPGIGFVSGQPPSWMMKLAAEEARRQGYKKTRKLGWQCRFCQKHRTKFST